MQTLLLSCRRTVNGVTSYYVGDYYEMSGGVVKKYYSAGGKRVALRSGGMLSWLLNNHLDGADCIISRTTETSRVRCLGGGAAPVTRSFGFVTGSAIAGDEAKR